MTAYPDLPAKEQAQLDAAASWHARLKADPSLEFAPDYLGWITDPDNRNAFAAVEQSHGAIAALSVMPEVIALRHATLGRIKRASAERSPWRAAVMGAIAASLIAVLAGGAYWFLRHQPTTFATDIGERRIVALPDGSRISMDSATELRVRYTKSARLLELDQGRARFDVAHDVTRPFSVEAGTETVVAVGTSFDVEKIGSKVLVTLIQGHVVIKDAAPAALRAVRPVALAAGEELVASLETGPTVRPVDMREATAWESGRLVFKNETMAEAVARINRYVQKPVQVDPSVASIRISGGFDAGDVGSFVSAVTSYLAVEAVTTEDNGILLQRRS